VLTADSEWVISVLPARNRANNQKRFLAGRDLLRQWSVWWFVRKVFFAPEKPQERSPLQCAVVPNRSPQHGIASFERVQHRALRNRSRDFERDFATHVGQCTQMKG
jgi:hypothetical protein